MVRIAEKTGIGPAIKDLLVLDYESIAHRKAKWRVAEGSRALGFDEHDVVKHSGPPWLHSKVWEEGEQTPEHVLTVMDSPCLGAKWVE
jgi:hypothetical protein